MENASDLSTDIITVPEPWFCDIIGTAQEVNMHKGLFDIMFFVVPIIFGIVFVFVMISIFSPKFRGKMMARQIKAMKHMMDEGKEDLKDIASTGGEVMADSAQRILKENMDTLEDIGAKAGKIKAETIRRVLEDNEDAFSGTVEKTADMAAPAVKKIVAAVAEGIKEGASETQVICSNCGAKIDADSDFCKHCGAKQ